MKKLASLLLVAMLAATMIAPVSAADNGILKGTPELDGEIDEIYTQSAAYVVKEDLVHYAWGDYADELSYDATAYFLYDDAYLYVAIEIKDDTALECSKADKNWQNDAAEMWFIDEGLKHKIHASFDGNFFLGADADGQTAYDFDGAKAFSAETVDGYSIEVALPMNDLGADKSFTFSLQVNNITVADASVGYAVGSQAADYELTCVADEVSYPEPETEAPAETEAEVVDAAVEAPAAPQTFDAGIVAAVAAIVSAAGYTLTKKR